MPSSTADDAVGPSAIKKMEEAIALSLSTNNFCDWKAGTIAEANRAELLKNAREIELAEAKRLVNSKVIEKRLGNIASVVAGTSHYSAQQLFNFLWEAERWPYRLLEKARRR
jgi:predicted GNAT superfamily acetyltransferase